MQEVQDPCLEQYLAPGLKSSVLDTTAQTGGFVHHTNHRLFPDELQRGYSRMDPMAKCKDSSFYNTDVWQPIAFNAVPFYTVLDDYIEEAGLTVRASSDEPSSPVPGDMTAMRKAIRRRYDGVLLALLRHKATGRVLCVGNTHLFYHPKFPEVKSMQAALMARATRQFIQSNGFALPSGAPSHKDTAPGAEVAEVILMGDLNSLPHRDTPGAFDLTQDEAEWKAQAQSDPMGCTSGAVTLWSTGKLDATHHEHPNQRGHNGLPALVCELGAMTSAAVAARGVEYPLTTRCYGMGGDTFEGTLDYIFVSSGLKVQGMLPMPYEMEGQLLQPADGCKAQRVAADFSKLPNRVWPSDHLAVVADVSFV